VVQADDLFAAADYVTLTDAANIAVDLSAGFNFMCTVGASRTLANPTNAKPGQSGFIDIVQPAGGGCTIGFAANYTFDQGVAPTVDTGANRTTSFFYSVRKSNEIRIAVAFKGVRAS
jgi:hypothetical protein